MFNKQFRSGFTKKCITGICLIAVVAVLFGCTTKGSSSGASSENSGSSTASSGADSPGSSSVDTSSATEGTSQGPLISDETRMEKGIYDVTDLVMAGHDSAPIKAVMRDETNIVALWVTYDENYTNIHYDGYVRNIETGEESKIFDYDLYIGDDNFDYGNVDYYPFYDVISSNPFIIQDALGGRIVYPEDDLIVRLDGFGEFDLKYFNDKVYCTSTSLGQIIALGETKEVVYEYDAPESYSFSPILFNEGEATLYRKYGANGMVFLSVDMDTKEYTEFTLDPGFPDYTSSSANRYLAFNDISENLIDLYDHEQGGKIEIDMLSLLGEAHIQSITDNYKRLAVDNGCACGDYFMINETNYDETIDKMYLVKISECDRQEWAVPEKVEYSTEAAMQKLEEIAARIETTYGIPVYYGLDGAGLLNIPDFYALACEDYLQMLTCIEYIENGLSRFPDDIFKQIMASDECKSIEFYITGLLLAYDATVSISEAGALANYDEYTGKYVVAFNVNGMSGAQTLVHEMTHVIDRYLIMHDVLDDTVWCSYNPETFEYYYAYVSEDGFEYSNIGDYAYTMAEADRINDNYELVYFVNSYGKTFPTEDRATLMETLLSEEGIVDECFAGRHLQDKLGYFFECIREGFNTSAWPEKTSWEEALDFILSL